VPRPQGDLPVTTKVVILSEAPKARSRRTCFYVLDKPSLSD
jgi:hypothetical protein